MKEKKLRALLWDFIRDYEGAHFGLDGLPPKEVSEERINDLLDDIFSGNFQRDDQP